MRLHRLLAAVAALLAGAHLLGSWYATPLLSGADALAWFAAAGYALAAPGLAPRTRYGLAVAGAALGVVALPADEQQAGQFLSPLPPAEVGSGGDQLRWAGPVLAMIALAVAVTALPARAAGLRHLVAAAALVVPAVGLAVARGAAAALPAYVPLIGLAVLVLLRSGAVPVVLGLVVAAIAALDVAVVGWPAAPYSSSAGLAFYSAAEFHARATGGGIATEMLWCVSAGLVLVGCRWAGRVPRRAHGAVRPGS